MAELMDLRELAAYLRLERQTLYNWLHQRKLSGIKVGGVWRFNRADVDRWLQAQTIQAAPAHTAGAGRHKRGTASAASITPAGGAKPQHPVAAIAMASARRPA